ncbi:MAG: apolipoprotein N-acyltransferase [Spirochaetales bacterium]|nr:apolipoprotein N-acyltransferase [Spirochaetales bacterium]
MNKIQKILIEIGLLVLSSVLFALSFPSFLSDRGWAVLAFIAVVPVFIVVHRCSWRVVIPYGVFYGYVTYAIFNYWLSTFHPLAIVIVPVIYAGYFFFVMPLLKAADRLFPKYAYLIQVLIWLGYEYIRSQGFLGYPYGNIGYSQYLFLPFIQISELTGHWGVSLMVIFPSAWLGNAIKDGFSGFRTFFDRHKSDVIAYGALFVLVLLYGAFVKYNYDEYPSWKVALVQHNSDTWKGGIDQYKKNFGILSEKSRQVVAENPDVQMVIWSETAFVPGIDWYLRYRTDDEYAGLVRDFLSFMEEMPVPVLTGNSHGEAVGTAPWQTAREHMISTPKPWYTKQGQLLERVDYNAVLLYADGTLQDRYRKTHLVPFTENFPYKKQMPGFYQMLVDHEYHFWERGTEADEKKVFSWAGVRFSTPICYEDVFGYLNRKFVKNGAQIIVNMTNDKWSGQTSAQMQHLGMAVFRAVENRRSVLRGTNSGMTVSIEPDGQITAMLEPFISDYLVTKVPVYDERETLYTKACDWFIWLVMIAAAGLLIFGVVRAILQRVKQGTE